VDEAGLLGKMPEDDESKPGPSYALAARAVVLLCALIVFAAAPASAQEPPGVIDQLDKSIGQRVETTVILGTANSIDTGAYKWNLDDSTVDITRLTWEFAIGDKKSIGKTGLQYVWATDGGVGVGNYKDEYTTGPLIGNEEKFQTYTFGENFGPRIFFTDDISVLPEAGFIYGYTVNEFNPIDSTGDSVIADSLVNWHVQTLTFTPSIQLQYQHTFFDKLRIQARCNYAYYITGPIERSTDFWSFRSDSGVLQNGVDVDYKTDMQLFGGNMHFGSRISRTDLYGGAQEATNVNHYYNIAGRVTFETDLWIVSMLGLGGSYTWGNGFHGYNIGIILGISF
jgi:hypothetical protein